MDEIADYLLEHYFPFFKDVIPTPERAVLIKALEVMRDRVVVIKGSKILGVAMFLTLEDDTYQNLQNIDFENMEVMSHLVKENGRHVHFVLLCAEDLGTILKGVRKVKREFNPKSVSWLSPDMKQLHRYNLN